MVDWVKFFKFFKLFKLCRMYQYPKNLFVLLPLFFSGKLVQINLFWPAVLTTIAFCLLASGTYIFNDWMDLDLDQQHPVKKNRPLASASWIKPYAFFLMLVLLILGCGLAYSINWNVLAVCSGYVILMIFYSLVLKHIPVIDLLVIAIGFVLRLLAGAFAVGVILSPYIVMMTFFLALFLGLGKRHHEFLYCQKNHIPTRPALEGYSERLFDTAIGIILSLMIAGYFMYTVLSGSPAMLKCSYLYLTTFFVIAGAMRYLQLIYVKKSTGDPTLVLFQDKVLLAIVMLWILVLGIILYG